MKWLIIALLSSAAFGQQVLFICSPQLPCPGFALGSVQAGIDQNGWRNFKLTLTQNVTQFSFQGTPPPAQALVSVIFTQDATGGRAVTFASSITNPCTITLAANATTLCQFEYDGISAVWIGVSTGGGAGNPGGSNTQVQVNNSGFFAGIPSAGSGSVILASGTSQLKSVIDARDIGVDCSFTNDSSTVLNALTLTGSTLLFPIGCHVKLTNTWLIKNQANFTIEGASKGSPQSFSGGTVISWCGATLVGPVIDLEFSGWATIEGIAVETRGTGCNNSASIGINVDKTGAGGTLNTTDLLFQRITVTPNLGGVAGPSGWQGIAFSLISGNNVEDMRVRDSNFLCQNTASSTAIVVGPSFNAKNEEFVHNNINAGCATGIWLQNGSAKIEMNEFTTTGIDVRIDTVADPNTTVVGNLSESSGQFLRFPTGAGTSSQPIEVSGNNIPLNSVCAVDTSNANIYVRAPNQYFANLGNGPFICDSAGLAPTIMGQFFLFAGLTTPQIQSAYPSAFMASRPSIRGPFATNNYLDMLFSGSYTLFKEGTFYSGTDNQDGLSSAAGGNQNQTPCGTNTYCAYEGDYELTGVPTPSYFGATVAGGNTSTQYGFFVSALDASGNETLLRGNNPYLIVQGPSTFDGSHFITLSWNTSASAASCNVYAVNVAASTQINKIGSAVPCGTFQVNSYPNTFPITTTQSGQNKTFAQTLRGRVQIQDMGSCTMAAGTCTAQALKSVYSAAPKCFLTWTGTGVLAGILKAPSTTSGVTPASSVNTDTAVVNWICYGN